MLYRLMKIAFFIAAIAISISCKNKTSKFEDNEKTYSEIITEDKIEQINTVQVDEIEQLDTEWLDEFEEYLDVRPTIVKSIESYSGTYPTETEILEQLNSNSKTVVQDTSELDSSVDNLNIELERAIWYTSAIITVVDDDHTRSTGNVGLELAGYTNAQCILVETYGTGLINYVPLSLDSSGRFEAKIGISMRFNIHKYDEPRTQGTRILLMPNDEYLRLMDLFYRLGTIPPDDFFSRTEEVLNEGKTIELHSPVINFIEDAVTVKIGTPENKCEPLPC